MRASDLGTMRRHAVIKTAEDEERDREEALAARRARARLGQRRKAKMEALEEARLAAEPLTELEQEEEEEKDRYRLQAAHRSEEAKDAAKAMNSMVAYARTVTVRDRQLVEKRERKAREREEARAADMAVEITRLEAVKRSLDKDEELRLRRLDAQVGIREQLEAAEARKRAAREARRVEAEETVARMRAVEEEDRQREAEKRRAKLRLRDEVKEANDAAMAERRAARERAVAEDRVLEEQQRVATEAAIEAEMDKERARLRREDEFFKLRSMVEKFQDDSEGQADTRMRRAFEEGQRRDREEAKRLAERRVVEAAELRRAREAQMEAKELARAAGLAMERREFESAQEAKREWMVGERSVRERRRAADRSHVQEVLRQAEERLAERKEVWGRTREEGKEGLKGTDAEMEALRQVRDRKVRELREAGVEGKYTVQLRGFDPRAAVDKDFKLGPPRARKSDGAAAPPGRKPA